MTLDNGPGFYERLIHRGVSRHEIERLYKKLKDKGYGENPPERRFQSAVRKLKTGRAVGTRTGKTGDGGNDSDSVIVDIPEGEYWANPDSFTRRAEDSVQRCSPSLRRKINKWAFRNGYRIVGIRERIRDFLSRFIPEIPDYLNDEFTRTLLLHRGYRNADPGDLGLTDTLDALHETSRFLLGRDRKINLATFRSRISEIERNVCDTLRRRNLFAYDFLQVFSSFDDKLDRNVEYLEADVHVGKRIETAELTRLVRQLYRFYYLTCGVRDDAISEILSVATDINLAYDRRNSIREELSSAGRIFKASIGRLALFSHDLYPALLKLVGRFYPEEDVGSEKLQRIYGFLRINESDILNYDVYKRKEKEALEERKAEQERQAAQEAAEIPGEEFSARFSSVLQTLDLVFPASGIGAIEKYPGLLPYFDTRVFTSSLVFFHQGQNIELVSRFDPVGQIMIFHRILDNLLNAVNEFCLEKLLESSSLGERFLQIKHDWKDVYTFLFEPYLELLTQCERDRKLRTSRIPEQGARNRANEEELNTLRNYCIKDFRNVLISRERPRTPRLYLFAERLSVLLQEIGLRLNMDLVKDQSAEARRLYAALADTPCVELTLSITPGTVDYRPATHRVRQYIETLYGSSIEGVPKLSQLRFFELFRDIASLYTYLLNDGTSFYRTGSGVIPTADEEDEILWKQYTNQAVEFRKPVRKWSTESVGTPEPTVKARSEETKTITSAESVYLEFQNRGLPFSVMRIAVDGFRNISAALEEPSAPRFYNAVCREILSALKSPEDSGFCLGRGEMIVLVTGDLETAAGKAESIRTRHEGLLSSSIDAPWLDARGVAAPAARGTLSIGVFSTSPGVSYETAVGNAERLLRDASETGNCIRIDDAAGHERSAKTIMRETGDG